MKNVELSIPDMQSAHCQARVNGAIKDIDGIKIEKLEAGKLAVSVESDEVKEELVEAIEKQATKLAATAMRLQVAQPDAAIKFGQSRECMKVRLRDFFLETISKKI